MAIVITRTFLLLVLLPLTSGCHRSGTWQDDAGNWQRAFQQDPPKDVAVVHSWYWRSPHFTYECEYFFELAPSPAFRKSLTESGELFDFTPDASTSADEKGELQLFFSGKPSWFLPKPIESYEVWKGKPPREDFRLFIDRETGTLFLTDHQI